MRARGLLLLVAPAFVSSAPHVGMEGGMSFIPSSWESLGETSRTETIELTFAIKQQNLDELEKVLTKVSTPSSPEYGHHLSNEEVHRLTAPKPEHLSAVRSFLEKYGATAHSATPNSDLIHAKVPVEIAETMLNAEYISLVHKETGVKVNRAPGGYSLPSDVAAAIDFVSPTVHIPGVRRPKQTMQSPNAGNTTPLNTPHNLRKLYNIGFETVGKAKDNKMAVTAFLDQTYSDLGLAAYWEIFCKNSTPSLQCGRGPPKLVGDETRAIAGGIEAMLDIETITGVAGNIESEFWGFAGKSPDNPENEPFMKWLAQVSNTSDADVPKIFSTSYGEDENSWSFPAAQRLNVEFQKAGARGISLLYASGDEGCNQKDGKFVPEGPGSSPYVTAVGGTMPGLGAHGAWPNPAGEWAIGLSSGGFSNYWKQPEWQKDAVANYLQQTGLPSASDKGYNVSGRAYPDISAQATLFMVINPAPLPGVSGTSCASPTAAGVFALLNDLRLQEGKSTLGFLNPFIYENAAAFNDITGGGGSGWPPKKGWDAVTGVGTPDYQRLAAAVAKLPAGRSTTEKTATVVI